MKASDYDALPTVGGGDSKGIGFPLPIVPKFQSSSVIEIPCLSLLSIQVIKIITESNFWRKGIITLAFLITAHHRRKTR